MERIISRIGRQFRQADLLDKRYLMGYYFVVISNFNHI